MDQDNPLRVLKGESISPGISYGILRPSECPGLTRTMIGRETAGELRRLFAEIEALSEELRASIEHLRAQGLVEESMLVQSHLAMLGDPQFHKQVQEAVEVSQLTAEAAVEAVMTQLAELMAQSGEAYFAARAVDFYDLSSQLRSRLSGTQMSLDECLAGVHQPILALPELFASTVLRARQLGVQGFVVCHGTALSHGAILARSFHLPVVRLGDPQMVSEAQDRQVLVDGDRGHVIVEPPPRLLQRARRTYHPVPASMALPAKLWLSIVDPDQLEHFPMSSVEGVGLYRTEILYIQHTSDFPSEQEQLITYRRVVEFSRGRPMVFRTVDLGADKPLAHMSLGPQENPYLGVRAHRIFRFHPEILVTQVRAILRATIGGKLMLMFPMIETLQQWEYVNQLVDQAIYSLRSEGVDFQHDFERGLLVETPSAAWGFDAMLAAADFASVGTNDLVQYFFAAERDNANVADLYRPEHPLFLSLLSDLAGRALEAGKRLSICGEIAADPPMAPLLVGLGYQDLSVSPPQIEPLRSALAATDQRQCAQLARRCLEARGPDEVRQLLNLPPRAVRAPISSAADQAVDPVCGMTLHKADTAFGLTHHGARYYFCSARCMKQFRNRLRSAG